jgi:uncharacterized protein
VLRAFVMATAHGSRPGGRRCDILLTAPHILLLIAAGLVAGLSNGIAGGGTLFSFPALLAVGLPALNANVTSTIGVWPSTIGGVAGFRTELQKQGRRVRTLLPASIGGSLAGCVLLLTTPPDSFRTVVPYLILAACGLFAVQPLVARTMRKRHPPSHAVQPVGASEACACEVRPPKTPRLAHAGVFVASVYGGYFGAAMGVILLAVLGIALEETLHRINGLRIALGSIINLVAIIAFVLFAHITWSAAGILAVTTAIGGYTGARLARRMPVWVLRTVVVAFGLAAAVRLLLA